MIGQTISHYKIVEKLGEGGMGVVYKAQDTKLDRFVALKFLPQYVSSDTNKKERFFQEARAAAALNHPNVAVIHEISEYEGRFYLAMECIEGQTLKKIVEHGERFSNKKVLEIAIQICEGLAAAHEKSIVHRDIKSDNIMVTPKGLVKIMDFGLAKVKNSTNLTKIGSTLGTAAYMSPEQARGEEVDNRSDIFSLGVVIYELFAGKLPFRGEHQAALMYSLVNEDPQPLAQFNENVSPEIERIISKTLAKDVEDRYQSVDDLLADLRRERKNIEYAKADYIKMSSSASQVKSVQLKKNLRRYYIPGSILIVMSVVAAYVLFFKQEGAVNSIAVLPFTTTSTESSAEILSDGITEGIINNLASLPSLTVKSRNSVFRYAGKDIDVQEVGKKLNVKAVILGRIIQNGDNYSISVELVDASNERHLWGAQYTKRASDINTLQGELSRDISEQLQVKLTGEEKKRLTKNNTENSEAYTLYIKGSFYLNKRTFDGLKKGIEYFEQAVVKDPKYALAYAGIADGYALLVDNYYIRAEEGYPKAKQAVLKALAIDNDLAEAHASLANVLSSYERKWDEAKEEYKKAIELNPNYSTAHHWYALILCNQKFFEEAMREILRAQELDPLSMRINQNVGFIFYSERYYDKCIEQQIKTIEIDSTFPGPHALMGDAFFMKKQYDKALHAYQDEIRLTGDRTSIVYIACVYAVTGRKKEALKLYSELKQISTHSYIPTSFFAYMQLYLGNDDEAILLLQKAVDEKDPIVTSLLTEPKLDPLRSDPRFNELLKKVNLIQ